MAAIVVFNDIFPLALNIAVAVMSVLAVVEIVKALGLAGKVVLFMPSLVFAAVTPFLPGTYWHEVAYYVYTVVIFSSLIFYHDTVTFREAAVIYSMTGKPRHVPCDYRCVCRLDGGRRRFCRRQPVG